MSAGHPSGDSAPGDEGHPSVEPVTGVSSYLVGLGLAVGLTIASFWVVQTDLVWRPAVPIALIALGIAQMGVHLVFFLHITSGPDHLNNSMALAFGVLIVVLLVGGSIWIMHNMGQNMMPATPGMPSLPHSH